MIKKLSLSAIKKTYFLYVFLLTVGSANNVFGVCNLPNGLVTQNITYSTAQLNWNATVCDSFLVRWNITGTTNYLYKTVNNGLATTTTITGLSPLTSYDWVIRTYCSGGTFGGYQPIPAQFTTITGPVACAKPAGLTTTNITYTSAQFNWSPAASDSFLIRYNVVGNSAYYYKKVVSGSATSAIIAGLTPLTNYSWVIHTYCNGGISGGYQSVPAQFTTSNGPVACAMPTGLTTTSITSTSAQCNWTPAVSDSFLIRYNVTGSTNYFYQKVSNGVASSATISGLSPLTNYSWVVHTYCNGGTSGAYQSVPAQFSTPSGPVGCARPGGLNTTNVTYSSAKLNWATTSCDSFLVRYNVTGSTNYSYITVKPGNATSVSINGLYPLTNYSWVVHTYCSGGISGPYQLTPATFNTLNGPLNCVIPNNTVTNSIGPNSAIVSWNTAIISDSFMVRYAVRNTNLYTWVKLPGTVHSYTIPYLSPNTTYEWWVKSICASAPIQAYSSSTSFTTLTSTCGAADPAYFGSSGIGYNTAVVNWVPVTGAVSYNVRYSVRYANTWITIPNVGTSKQLTGLQASTWYEFQVQVVCGNGAGAWSSSGIFQTTGTTLTLTRGPYLQQSTTSSIYLRWRTSFASNSRVKYGTAPNNLTLLKDDGVYTTEHVVQLTGLSSNTKYYYSIGSTTVTLQGDTGNYFLTNPPVGSTGAVRIWTIGDFGVNSTGQKQVRDAYMNYPSSANTNVWLWVGDNAYTDGTDAEYSTNVFSVYPYQMKKWVIWPATGNHDLHTSNAFNQTGPYFDSFTLPKSGEVGGVPSNTEAYYSFNYANIHFICLESNDAAFRSVGGAMYNWLTSDLAANTQRWTIVYFHHPPYSKGSHDSDTETELVEMRTNIVPLLENYKVDLVLAGHSHSFERSMMLKGHFGNEASFNAATMAINSGSGIFPSSYTKSSPTYSGTVYVVCGVSGQIGATTPGWPHNAMYASSLAYFGSLVIDVVGDRLDCKFLTQASTIYDQFTIQKTGVPFKKTNEALDAAVPAADPIQVFPNPMTLETNIHYVVDNTESVRLEITDLTGRILYTMLNGNQDKGEYDITLSKSDAMLSDGIYFIRMIAGEKTYLHKIIVNE